MTHLVLFVPIETPYKYKMFCGIQVDNTISTHLLLIKTMQQTLRIFRIRLRIILTLIRVAGLSNQQSPFRDSPHYFYQGCPHI